MKIICSALALTACLLPLAVAHAEDPDVSHQKQVRREINNHTAGREKVSATAPGGSGTTMTERLGAEVPRLAGAPGRGQTIEGTFTGIEQGDYAHWNLREADGTARSFFILQTDAAIDRVLADPQEYEGRPCRIRWERRTENIPEAGGPMEIDVILAVDWL
jgi:hypothetical protein